MISDNEGLKQSGFDVSVKTPGGNQRELWRHFYAAQWAYRSRFIEDLIESGETNALRLLTLLERFERKHEFHQEHIFSDAGHSINLNPKLVTFDGEEITPAGVPGFRESSLCRFSG